MAGFRRYCSRWALLTYSQTLNKASVNVELKKAVRKCLVDLKMADLKVNGYSCEGLPKTDEGALGVKINYTDVFHNLVRRDRFSPVNYVIELIRIFREKQYSSAKLNGFIARSMRTLTSLLREPDFAELLETSLYPHDRKVIINLNPVQDAGDHTDVLLTFRRKTYRIWLFQFSDRGLPHDIERVSGKRGDLPNGIHVLCPLHTEVAIKTKKLTKRVDRLKSMKERCIEKLNECSDRAIMRRTALKRRIDILIGQITETSEDLSEAKVIADNELDVVDGWFFYSTSHVRRVIDSIRRNTKPLNYERVKSMLLAPERFLSEIKIFEKE